MPLTFLLMWLTGLLSFGILGGGIYILWEWYQSELQSTGWLWAGIAMVIWSLVGRSLAMVGRRRGIDEPRSDRSGRSRRVVAADGAELQAEEYGPETRSPLVMTHGWDLDATAWYYEKKHLAPPFRLILWDLPGLGLSSQPSDGRYSLERFAQNLKMMIDATAAGRPVVLLGHSIGGMTLLTFCRLFPEMLGTTVSGLILVNTTHTMPLNTVWGGSLLRALQKPVLVPLLHLTIWLSPLVWAMNWLSYLNGSSHRTTNWTSFSGKETWGQLDFAARFTAKQSPGVLAKGILAMFAWEETATLPRIGVPTLIITGEYDKLTLPTAAEYMASTIPGSKLVRIASAGHTGFLEQSQAYDDAITNFLIGQRLLQVDEHGRVAATTAARSASA